MSSERNDLDEGPSEEASGQEENYEGSKSGLSETYDMRDFCPGIRIEAQDFDGKWYPAKVADVDWTENEILVHFENRNTKFDEWIPMDSSRLRSLPKPLVHTPKESVKFVKGEEVMAMWSPYQKYPATIQAVLANDRYDVLFYDGFLKRLKAHKISKVDGGVVRSEVRNFSDIGTKEERRERKRKINVAELFHVNKRTKKKGLVHSKSQDMKTYPVNKSRAKSSIVKNSLAMSEGKEHGISPVTLPKLVVGKPLVPAGTTPYLSRSLIDTIPAAVEVKYLDGRTEMWSKQLYQRSEGRTAGKLDIVILNPQGRKFRSRNEIMKFCEENGIIYTHDSFDFSVKGRPKSKPQTQGVNVKPDSASEDVDKISLKKMRRKSQLEEPFTTPNTQPPPVPGESNNYAEDKVFIGDVEVVVENGKFICPVKICGKHFRRENLLHMHVKHYHPEFSKFLDYTPSVTDLAYMRTVGSLETSEPSPSAPRKVVIPTEKIEKAPVKTEKSTKTSILVNDGAKEIKKSSQKPTENKTDAKTILAKLPVQTSPATPIHASSEIPEDTKPPELKSISETFQIFKNSTPMSTNHAATQENPSGFVQESTVETTADESEDLSLSSSVSKSIKHSRFYRQKKGARIRGSFVDHIKRKKYIGQDLSRSAYRLGRSNQTQAQPSAPLQSSQAALDDQSNSNTSSQAFSMSRTPKLQLSISNETSGKNNSLTSFSNVTTKRKRKSSDPCDEIDGERNGVDGGGYSRKQRRSSSMDYPSKESVRGGHHKKSKRSEKNDAKQFGWEAGFGFDSSAMDRGGDECKREEMADGDSRRKHLKVIRKSHKRDKCRREEVFVELSATETDEGDAKAEIRDPVSSESEDGSEDSETEEDEEEDVGVDEEGKRNSSGLLENVLRKESKRKVEENGDSKRKLLKKRRENDGTKSKKKVRFESLHYSRWSDSGEEGESEESRQKPEDGTGNGTKLDRRPRERSKNSRYINYLNKKDLNGYCIRRDVSSSTVVDEKCVVNFDLSSDLDHTEGTEDSKSPFNVESEKVEKLRRNEIINCVCGVTEEDGLMIQCDLCLCWQHGHCMDILRDSDVPDKYICSICRNPFRGRSSMKYVHDQDWLKEGTLPCLSFRSKRDDLIEQRRTILKRSYDLSGSISLLSQVIHSLRVKVNIAEKKDHPKLWLWAKKWIEKKPSRLMEEVKEEKPIETTVSSEQKTEGLLSVDEQQLPKVPEPEAPIDSAECRLNLLDHLIHYQTLVDARLSCIESLVAELESMQDDAVDDEAPDRYPRTKATIQMILRDLNTMKKIAAI